MTNLEGIFISIGELFLGANRVVLLHLQNYIVLCQSLHTYCYM